jgi:hypothetical protein
VLPATTQGTLFWSNFRRPITPQTSWGNEQEVQQTALPLTCPNAGQRCIMIVLFIAMGIVIGIILKLLLVLQSFLILVG